MKSLDTIKHLFFDYTDHSTIHGVSYIGEKDRTWIERVWWITVFCISVLCCGKLIFDAWNINPIIISFASKSTPIWQIPFPAVTICPGSFVRNADVNLTDIYRRQLYEANFFDNFTDQKKMQIVAKNTFCTGRSQLNDIMTYDNCNECLEILREIRIPFNEFFVECSFGNQAISCLESFEEVIISNHLCYIFNGLPIYRQKTSGRTDANWTIDEGYKATAPMDTYPHRATRAGSQYGLSLILKSSKQNLDYFCSFFMGYRLEYHMPYESPQFFNDFLSIRMEDSLFLTVKPKMMTTADELRTYSPAKRKCYFSNEYQLKYFEQYTHSNCELECEIDSIIQHCQCVPVNLNRQKGLNICGPMQINCSTEARNVVFRQSFAHCKCLPACSSISFESEVLVARLNESSLFRNPDSYQSEFGYSQLKIFFKENQVVQSQRTELYGATAFLANCGGLLGLFLGVSIISFLEIVYFCTIRLWFDVRKNVIDDHDHSLASETIQNDKGYLKITKELIAEYFGKTTIQGIKYVAESKLSMVERVWWTIILVISLLCCGSLIANTFKQYDQSPVIISYANEETSISAIPFPAVTICPQIVSRHVVSMYDYFKVQNRSLYDLDHFRSNIATALAQACDLSLFGDIDPQNLTNCENCSKFLNFLIGNMYSLFKFCRHETQFNRCTEAFSKVMTEKGACVAYNTLEVYRNFDEITRDDVWTLEDGYTNNSGLPRKGTKFALNFALIADKKFNDALCRDSLQGFKIYLHLPNEAPQISKHFYVAPYSHYTQIMINPRVTITAPELRDLSIEKRQCYFSDERHLRFFRYYTQSNCELECVVNMTLSQCGCLMFHMPKIPDVKFCGISEIKCHQLVVEQNFKQSQTSVCHCLATCTSIAYDSDVNYLYMSDDVLNFAFGGYAKTHGISIVDIVFRVNQFVAMKRSKLFDQTELMANCGGLLGLFLGFSFMSLLELAYFCTIRLFCDVRLRARRN